MSEQTGPSVIAMQARQSALATRHGTVVDADGVLSEVLASAHATIRESVRRLDAIADEIDSAVLHQSELAVDTPMGAREFHKFLLANSAKSPQSSRMHATQATRERLCWKPSEHSTRNSGTRGASLTTPPCI